MDDTDLSDVAFTIFSRDSPGLTTYIDERFGTSLAATYQHWRTKAISNNLIPVPIGIPVPVCAYMRSLISRPQ